MAEDFNLDNSSFVNETREQTIIKVIGVGGGGNNAVNHMYEQGIDKVSFVVCNTDQQALNNSPIPNRLLIGPRTCRGLGAGNKPAKAHEAAIESTDEIGSLFDDDTKMVFITAGMGGGTGTGAAPVVAQIAHDRGLLTIGIVTIPFFFEGEKKILKALDGAEEMSKYVDALLVVNNEQLTEIYPDLDWVNAFGKADDTLSNAARSISELITCTGYMNLDFEDVDTTLRNGGAAVISTGFGEGEHRVTKAIEDALHSPLLKNRDIYGSKRLLFNLYFSPKAEKPFVMSEANELTAFISNIDKGVDVIYGICFDETLGDKIKITILAAGFDLTIKGELSTSKPRKKEEEPTPRKSTPAEPADVQSTLAEMYGKGKVEEAARARELKHYIIMRPDQMDNDGLIETFEHHPAYNRDLKLAESLRNEAEAAAPAAQVPAKAAQAEAPAADTAANPAEAAGTASAAQPAADAPQPQRPTNPNEIVF